MHVCMHAGTNMQWNADTSLHCGEYCVNVGWSALHNRCYERLSKYRWFLSCEDLLQCFPAALSKRPMCADSGECAFWLPGGRGCKYQNVFHQLEHFVTLFPFFISEVSIRKLYSLFLYSTVQSVKASLIRALIQLLRDEKTYIWALSDASVRLCFDIHFQKMDWDLVINNCYFKNYNFKN